MWKDEGVDYRNSRYDVSEVFDRNRLTYRHRGVCCTMMTCHSPWKPFTQGINKVVQGRALLSCIYTEYITIRHNVHDEHSMYTSRGSSCTRVNGYVCTYTHISRFARESNGTRYRSECVENAIDSLGRPVDLFHTLCSSEDWGGGGRTFLFSSHLYSPPYHLLKKLLPVSRIFHADIFLVAPYLRIFNGRYHVRYLLSFSMCL